MNNPLVVTPHDVAQCLQVCDSTFRCFATVSRPLALPFSRVPDLKWAISNAVAEANGGHNGIYIDGDAPSGMDIDPHWPGDYTQIT